MTRRVTIIGAGVLGSAIAWRLAGSGADVTLLDPEPGQGASAGSLAWLNASFASDPVYNALRRDSMTLWKQMLTEHPGLPVRFPGAILFDNRDIDLAALTGPSPDRDLGTRALESTDARELEPALVVPPERAVFSLADGFGEPAEICDWFLDRARREGARLIRERATGVATADGRVTGVTTYAQTVEADHVVLAAGIDLPGLLEKLGLAVAMENQSGLSMRTEPLDARLRHLLATPDGDLWQGEDGRILMASSPRGDETAEMAAARALGTVGELLGQADPPPIQKITPRDRPIPADGRPAVGPLGPDGLYVVSMHSGMTLAPVMAEMVSQEITTGQPDARLNPYRPDRAVLQRREASA